MLFNSYIFLFLFLPLCLAGYYILNRIGQKRLALLWLFGMSLWFYATNTPKYLFLILASIIVNFGFYRLSRVIKDKKLKTAAMVAAVAANLAVLFYYKYFSFFVFTVKTTFNNDWTLKNILLPLGISFFTFQQISFVVDAYRGDVPDYGFLDYACFVTFFPQLIAGPIVTHDELVPQLMDESRKRFDFENFARGIYIFSMGLAKKVLIADNLSFVVTTGYNWAFNGQWELLNSTSAIIVMLSYTFQMYFDFSGYSDMAIGIGKMFNVDLPQNFNSPYKAITIVDHWKRWHLTLTRFLTKYVYIPLGGSRKGRARTYINIVLVYLISGIWHGAGWTYIFWGLLHGIFNALTRLFHKFFDRIPKVINWFITFAFINLGFIIFRAPTLDIAFTMIGRLFSFDFGPVSSAVLSAFCLPEVQMVLGAVPFVGRFVYYPPIMTALMLALCFFLVLVPRNAYEKMQSMQPRFTTLLFSLMLVVWCIFCFGSVSEFLYFNF